MLNGVSGVVERGGRRALSIQVMGEPMVQASTEGREEIGMLGRSIRVRRREGPVRGENL